MDKQSEYEQAKEILEQLEKKRFIEDFETHRRDKTDYSVKVKNGFREFYYGIPVFEDGKLTSFQMMKFMKMYDADTGMNFRSDDEPYKDQDGRDVFMSVDAYLKFYKEMEQQDTRIGIALRQARKEVILEDMVLSNNPLSKARRKIAKAVDRTLENIGVESHLEKVKTPKWIKKGEKEIGNIIANIKSEKSKK
ncbi:MAG: hypothetical protein IJ770_05520 [Alphaproteobacteria bacterium]|nr:hypothetical protein [Alphaproteobacteria bacterium]